MIKFRCPNCTQKIGVNDEGADAVIGCPTCAAHIVVPPESSPEFRPLPALILPAVDYVDDDAGLATRPAVDPALDNGTLGADQVRQALIPHLAGLLRNKLVQALLAQRRHLMSSQSLGTEQVEALEHRLVTLQENYAARLKTYQVRVTALEHQLAALEEQNRGVAREKFLLEQKLEEALAEPAGGRISGVERSNFHVLLRA